MNFTLEPTINLWHLYNVLLNFKTNYKTLKTFQPTSKLYNILQPRPLDNIKKLYKFTK